MDPRPAVVALFFSVAGASLAVGQETPPPKPAAAPSPLSEAAAGELQQAKDAFKKGDCAVALGAAQKVLVEQPKHLEGLYIAGTCERQTNQLDAAEGHITALLESSPNFPLAHFQLGYVEFLKAEAGTREGRADEAKALYGKAADEFGLELSRNASHGASLSSRAIALSRAGRTDEAINAHEAWIAAAPQKNDPVVSLAVTHATAGRSSEAMATLDRLPDATQPAAFAAVMSAAAVFTAKRDFGAAIPFFEKAVATDPTSTRARTELTIACARAGEYDDAVASLTTLMTLEPTPDEAESAGEAIVAALGDGKTAPTIPGVQPPTVLKIPTPRYPKNQDTSVRTQVLILALVRADNTIGSTVMVPNRIWKDIRLSGFEQEASDAVKRGKFVAGAKNGAKADLWVAVSVQFTGQ